MLLRANGSMIWAINNTQNVIASSMHCNISALENRISLVEKSGDARQVYCVVDCTQCKWPVHLGGGTVGTTEK